MNLNYLKDKKILILGFAREGQDTFLFLRKLFPKKTIGIADKSPLIPVENCSRPIKAHLGENYLQSLKNYDIIIKSPGIAPKTIKPFLTKRQKITSQTQIFFENCLGKIIGITGTKGKSTTASLIYRVLKKGGLKAHLVGNIGKPALSLLFKAKPDDIFVYELSSHQLSNLKQSPLIAVFLNIYPEHLDYYKDFKEYLKTKQNICRFQKKQDFFLFNPENRRVKETAKIAKAKRIPLDSKIAEKFLKEWGSAKLLGKANLLNMATAIQIGRLFKIPEKTIAFAIKTFKPLPHRLELVGEWQGIKFYNDSLATIPEATIAALDALGNNVQTLIAGGFDRGLKFENLAKKITKSRIKTLILFPTTGQIIWQTISKAQKTSRAKLKHFFVNNMEEAVKMAFRNTQKRKICLLSCASASFNLFRDYKERGDLFKKYVRKFARR